jgi:hypothetical protein
MKSSSTAITNHRKEALAMNIDAKFPKANPETKRLIIKTLNKMVAEGKLEFCMINGEPGVRRVTKEKPNA